jgi:hypothetical protein
MSSLTNINNNSSVVNVGRTLPVSPGQQPAAKSIPVVLASDQPPVPVIEQNKIQSEVALSLLGIPRSEVALGIFADVNTYDVNPAEWSTSPLEHTPGYGVKHLAEEAGALVEAPKNKVSILTSKRFFRYQPGRVSSATFGVKNTKTQISDENLFNLNPSVKKYGIFDKYDGYYWEVNSNGEGDRFSVVRRTQSLLKYISVPFGSTAGQQTEDYSMAGKGPDSTPENYNEYPLAVKSIIDNRFTLIDDAFAAAVAIGGTVATYLNGLSASDRLKCNRDMDFAIDAYTKDLQWSGNAHTIVNATTYQTAILNNPAGESAVHEKLRDEIIELLDLLGETAASAKISTLAAVTISAVGGVQPTQLDINNANYGQRSKISTVFDIYSKYYAYLVSKSINYTDTNPNISVQEIEYRCLRDVRYIMEGYARDLEFGGNAATVFNAKNYYFDGIQVYSQTFGGVVGEITRHQYLKNLVSSSTNVAIQSGGSPTGTTVSSLFIKFGLASLKTTFDSLADIIIGNFSNEYSGQATYGSAAQYGNLIIYRDNLLMIHAAVFDPSLLKASKQIVVKIDAVNDTIECAEDTFVIGQHIKFIGNAAGLTNEKVYKVVNVAGPKSNIIKICDPLDDDETVINITTIGTGVQFIEPYVPFIFPKDYQVGSNPEDPAGNFIKLDAAFPYLYTQDGVLPATVESKTIGFIDTGIDPSVSAALLKSQIDLVNLRWNNWIKQNVDPKYYSVYEYRIPRSRFSTDQLNGEVNKTVYSDIATSETGKAYAGQSVIDDGVQKESISVWELDFTKVTMLKVEFSWYGAVGALFLAYVPVSNGEARWVRVHHLRASNQLKIPSLGNATLPITYLVFGGGDVNQVGIEDTSDKGYGNSSEHIVKYGASYYIDGGDRGTVRLYSYSTDELTPIYGSTYLLGNLTLLSDAAGQYIDVTDIEGLPSNKTYFMSAKLLTSSREDQNVEIIWIDGNKLYINKLNLISESGLKLVANRPSIVFGLKSKDNILNATGIGVRNRVQVYPTKLSTANLGNTPVKLKVLKTPFYQPVNVTSGNFTLSSNYTVTPSNLPLPVVNSSYLSRDGNFVYGWFKSNVGTVLGKLYRETGNYYFQLLQTFSTTVILESEFNFLKEGRFDFQGQALTGVSESTITKERLSSVFISSEIQSPVPRTGTEVASFFLKPGSDQFDLLSYFDYNKDYLSYPLTDQIESIYLAVDSIGNNQTDTLADINASLTWEEQ